MVSDEKDLLAARWHALAKQVHVLRRVRAGAEDEVPDLNELIDSLNDLMDEIESQISQW